MSNFNEALKQHLELVKRYYQPGDWCEVYLERWREFVPVTPDDLRDRAARAWCFGAPRVTREMEIWGSDVTPTFPDVDPNDRRAGMYGTVYPITPCHWASRFLQHFPEEARAGIEALPDFRPNPSNPFLFLAWMDFLDTHPERRAHWERFKAIFPDALAD